MKKRVCLSVLFLITTILILNLIIAQETQEKPVEQMNQEEINNYVQEIANIETLTSENSEKIKTLINKKQTEFMQAFEKLTSEQQARLFYDKTDTRELFLSDDEKNKIWNYLNQEEKQPLLQEIANKFLKQTYKEFGESSAYPELKGQTPKIENVNIDDSGNTLKWQGNKLINQQQGYINFETGYDQIDLRTSSINYNGESFELGFLKNTKFFTYNQGTFAYNTEYPQGCVIGPDGKIIGGDKKLTFLYGKSSEQNPTKISVEYTPKEKSEEGEEAKYIAEFSLSGDLKESSLTTVDKYGNNIYLKQQSPLKKGKFVTTKTIVGYGGLFGRRPIYGYTKKWVPDKTPVKQTFEQPATIKLDEKNMIAVKNSQINTAGRGVFTSPENNFQILAGNFFNEPEKGLRDLEAEIEGFAVELLEEKFTQAYKSKLENLDENSAEYEKEIDKLSKYLIENKADKIVQALENLESIRETAQEVGETEISKTAIQIGTGFINAIKEGSIEQLRNTWDHATTSITVLEEQTPEEKESSGQFSNAVFIALTRAIGDPIVEKAGQVLSLRKPISAAISAAQEMDLDASKIEQQAIQKFAEKSLNPSYKQLEEQKQDYIYINDNKNEITGGIFSEIRIGTQNPVTVDVTEFHGTLDKFSVNDYTKDENKVNLLNGGFSMTFDKENTYYQRGSTPYSRTEIKQIENTNSEKTWVLDKSYYKSFRLYDPAKLRSYTHSQSGFGIFGMLRNYVAGVEIEGAPTGDKYIPDTNAKVKINLLQSGRLIGLVPQATVTGQLAQKISQGTYDKLSGQIQSTGGQEAFLEQLEQAKRLTTNENLKTIATQRGWYDPGIKDQIYLAQNLNQLDAVTYTISNLHNQYNLQRSTIELANDGIYLNGQQIPITDSSGKTVKVDSAVYRQIKHGIATETGSPQVYGLIQAFSMKNQPTPSPHNLDQEFNFLSKTTGRGTSTTSSTITPPTPPQTQPTPQTTTSTIPKPDETWDDKDVKDYLKIFDPSTNIQTQGFTSESLNWGKNLITDKTNPELSLNLDKIPKGVKEIQYIKATDSESSKLIYEFENQQQIILEKGSLDENMQLIGSEFENKDISFEFGKENPEDQKIIIHKDGTIEIVSTLDNKKLLSSPIVIIGNKKFLANLYGKQSTIKIIDDNHFKVKNIEMKTNNVDIITDADLFYFHEKETDLFFNTLATNSQQYVQISEDEIKVKGDNVDVKIKKDFNEISMNGDNLKLINGEAEIYFNNERTMFGRRLNANAKFNAKVINEQDPEHKIIMESDKVPESVETGTTTETETEEETTTETETPTEEGTIKVCSDLGICYVQLGNEEIITDEKTGKQTAKSKFFIQEAFWKTLRSGMSKEEFEKEIIGRPSKLDTIALLDVGGGEQVLSLFGSWVGVSENRVGKGYITKKDMIKKFKEQAESYERNSKFGFTSQDTQTLIGLLNRDLKNEYPPQSQITIETGYDLSAQKTYPIIRTKMAGQRKYEVKEVKNENEREVFIRFFTNSLFFEDKTMPGYNPSKGIKTPLDKIYQEYLKRE